MMLFKVQSGCAFLRLFEVYKGCCRPFLLLFAFVIADSLSVTVIALLVSSFLLLLSLFVKYVLLSAISNSLADLSKCTR